jgi:hypothetical protein
MSRTAPTSTSALNPRTRPPFGSLAALMPDVFWIGVVLAAAIFLIGVFAGARSSITDLRTGAAVGAYLGVMLAFPLLAIGLATS